jgi:hypothetical protein
MKKICSIIALSLLANYCEAQWTINTQANVPVCTMPNKQGDPRIMEDGNGGAFIAWKDWRNNNVPDIFIQHIDINGIPTFPINGLNLCTNTADQSTPSICSDDNGGAIVTWSDWRTPSNERDIYAQRIDANGLILWSYNGAAVTTKTNREHNEKICSDGKGGAYIAWEQQSGIGWDIWAQHLAPDGTRLWGNGGMAMTTVPGNRINVKIQSDKKGGAFLTWQDERSGSYDVYAQKVDSAGTLLWGTSAKLICGAANVQTTPKIDPDPSIGGVYLCWIDKRSNIDYDIYAQRIDSNGVAQWITDGKPVMQGGFNQSAQDIVSNNNVNGIIVTWKDNRNGNTDIYAQKLDKNGNMKWGVGGIPIAVAPFDQSNPNIIGDKDNGAIIVWQSVIFGFSENDILAQRVDSNGTKLWGPNGVAVCNAPGLQSGPKNTTDDANGTIVVWEDERIDTNRNIFIQRIDASGSSLPLAIATNNVNHSSLYPNPFTNTFDIEVGLINNQTPNITLTDIHGRKVMSEVFITSASNNQAILRVRTNSGLPQGVYYVMLDGQGAREILKVVKE